MKCPRCDSETIKIIPVVHDRFKVKPEDIDKLPILPPIPPLESR